MIIYNDLLSNNLWLLSPTTEETFIHCPVCQEMAREVRELRELKRVLEETPILSKKNLAVSLVKCVATALLVVTFVNVSGLISLALLGAYASGGYSAWAFGALFFANLLPALGSSFLFASACIKAKAVFQNYFLQRSREVKLDNKLAELNAFMDLKKPEIFLELSTARDKLQHLIENLRKEIDGLKGMDQTSGIAQKLILEKRLDQAKLEQALADIFPFKRLATGFDFGIGS